MIKTLVGLSLALLVAGCAAGRLGNYGNTKDWPHAEPAGDAKAMELCKSAGKKDC